MSAVIPKKLISALKRESTSAPKKRKNTAPEEVVVKKRKNKKEPELEPELEPVLETVVQQNEPNIKLFDYQTKTIDKMCNLTLRSLNVSMQDGEVLFSVPVKMGQVKLKMGAGKTIISFGYMQKREDKKFLVLVPHNLIMQWRNEVYKFSSHVYVEQHCGFCIKLADFHNFVNQAKPTDQSRLKRIMIVNSSILLKDINGYNGRQGIEKVYERYSKEPTAEQEKKIAETIFRYNIIYDTFKNYIDEIIIDENIPFKFYEYRQRRPPVDAKINGCRLYNGFMVNCDFLWLLSATKNLSEEVYFTEMYPEIFYKKLMEQKIFTKMAITAEDVYFDGVTTPFTSITTKIKVHRPPTIDSSNFEQFNKISYLISYSDFYKIIQTKTAELIKSKCELTDRVNDLCLTRIILEIALKNDQTYYSKRSFGSFFETLKKKQDLLDSKLKIIECDLNAIKLLNFEESCVVCLENFETTSSEPEKLYDPNKNKEKDMEFFFTEGILIKSSMMVNMNRLSEALQTSLALDPELFSLKHLIEFLKTLDFCEMGKFSQEDQNKLLEAIEKLSSTTTTNSTKAAADSKKKRTYLQCCKSFSVCTDCALILQRNEQPCPRCSKNDEKIEDMGETSKSASSQLKPLKETLIDLKLSGKTAVVFEHIRDLHTFDVSTSGIVTNLEGIFPQEDILILGDNANSQTIGKRLKDFEFGPKNIMLINSGFFSFGINLAFVKNVILLTEINNKDQLIARFMRPGRTEDLQLYEIE